MLEVHRLLRLAGLRMVFGRFVSLMMLTLAIALGALIVLLLLERLLAFSTAWPLPLVIGGVGALVVGIVITLVRWPDRLEVAREVDERAALRESLSTAVCVETRQDAWSLAAVTQARDTARRVTARSAFPVAAPRRWPAPLALAAAFAVLWLALPQWDVLGYIAQSEEQARIEQERQEVIAQVAEADQTIEDALAAIDEQPEPGDDQSDSEFDAPRDPEAIKQIAIRKLTSVSDRLAESREGVDGLKLDAMRENLSQLKDPGDGPLTDIAEALKQGDFEAAQESLQQMLEKIESGDMSESEIASMREQLQNMAKQIEQLAQNKDALEQKLSELGLDPSLASDPNALQDALQNAPGLSQQQRDAIQNALDGMQSSQNTMQQMAQAMSDAAQQGQSGQQGISDLAGQLSEMEMLQAEMDQIDAASQQVWGQLSKMSGSQGGGGPEDMLQLWDRQQPGGSGQGRGPGGGKYNAEESPFSTTKEKSVGADLGGPVVGTRLVEGEQIVGESRAEFVEAVRSGSQNAADAIESQRIPREYHDAVKHYFGRLDAKAKGEELPEGEQEGESSGAESSDGSN